MAEREVIEVDVLIVGAGVAGLACAIELAERIKHERQLHPERKIAEPNILVIEKGTAVGAHVLSGCILDPKALNELLPDWKARGAPIRQAVRAEEIAYLTPSRKHAIPALLVPPYLHNQGHYIVSLGEVAHWMAEQAKALGVEILEGVGGAAPIISGQSVLGVTCGDTGLDKNGEPGPNHVPGARIIAKATVFAEGARGSLTKELVQRLKLDANRNPQSYSVGLKELWELPAGRFPAGKVLHTLGFPLQGAGREAFGGSFLYGQDETHLSIGLVVGLDYKNPALDPHEEFQRLKLHPHIRPLLEGGQLLAYGAKTLPEGGYHALPRFYGEGFMIVGDSAGFLNAARLKGAHLAIKSGMLAAETLAEAYGANDYSTKRLGAYEDRFQTSWAREELYAFRNWRQAYAQGIFFGAIHDLAQRASGGRGFRDPMPASADHLHTERWSEHHDNGQPPPRLQPDGKLTFDKVSDVYRSGTVHGESQPVHLVVPDPRICVDRCTVEYGNPCQHFCPAAVYEWMKPEPSSEIGTQYGIKNKGHLRINAGNCVHCKTCDIKDPYENILWVVPEGGDGPRYQKL